MATGRPIPPSECRTIAKHGRDVSVNLLVNQVCGIVSGKRQNEPAKREWVIPGGTVLKGETRRQAINRVARGQLGVVTINRELSVYNNFYETVASDGLDSKQYLAMAYAVIPVSEQFEPNPQHADLRSFNAPFPELHDCVRST